MLSFLRAAPLAPFALWLALASAAPAQEMRIVSLGTAGIDGNYFAMGRALCAAVQETAPADLRCSPEPTPGSHYNLVALAERGLEFAIVQSDWQREAVEGTGLFEGPVEGLRAVASLYPEAVTIVVRGDSGIDSIDDLAGRRVDIGDVSTARRATNVSLLSALGFTQEEIDVLPGLSGAAVTQELCGGRVDATMIVIGHPSNAIREMLRACDLRLLPVDGRRLRAVLEDNAAFSAYTLPAETYAGIARDVPMLAVTATLVVRDGVEDAVVALFARALAEKGAAISRRAPVFRQRDPQAMATDGLTAPLHPAAAAVLGAAD
jgi:TRAP transporter TAXI family solute receptor